MEATARLLAPVIRGSTASVRWSGNLAAHSYDLAVRRRSGTWRTVTSRVAAKSYRLKGSAGESLRVRVRAWNVDGAPGPWSPARTLALGSRAEPSKALYGPSRQSYAQPLCEVGLRLGDLADELGACDHERAAELAFVQ